MPLVSVIVPNYNHADYLDERLSSIYGQTFTDFEVILLDDASTDNSLDILRGKIDDRTRLFPNRINSGSPFAQWNKGVNLAKGKYIWIAESDDVAEPTLLQTLVDLMESDEDIVLAFSQSMLINEKGKPLHSFAENYRYLYNSDRWEQAFVASGKDECVQYLLTNNTIPNASAVLMRKSAYDQADGAPAHFKLNGDWLLYAKVLIQGKFAFTPQVLNRFRTHGNTQRHNARRSVHAFTEMISIQNFIVAQAHVDQNTLAKARQQVAEWWVGGIAHQTWFRKGFWKENCQLYRAFSPHYRALWLRILWHLVYASGWYVLYITGLLALAKKIRHWLFPGKFFNPQSQQS
ncbi:MAG: glycosyltransferase family 2 protein [Cryomorphaceae bacterium]|nr:glycosyltransferase family 2 protein [Cryomorphaceae bacterium]